MQIESSFFPCSRSSRYHNNFCFLQINKVEYRKCNFSCTKLRLSNHVDNLISTSCRCAVIMQAITVFRFHNFCSMQLLVPLSKIQFLLYADLHCLVNFQCVALRCPQHTQKNGFPFSLQIAAIYIISTMVDKG